MILYMARNREGFFYASLASNPKASQEKLEYWLKKTFRRNRERLMCLPYCIQTIEIREVME